MVDISKTLKAKFHQNTSRCALMLALVGANTPVQDNGTWFEIEPQPFTTISGIFFNSSEILDPGGGLCDLRLSFVG